ncbi:MAG: DNA repair protein RecN [Pseudomonadota bacterium]
MLTCIRVRDLVIIEQQEVLLEPGLNVVTGETGAGKSILVDALQLVLGARGNTELVRTGADQAEVEALFDVGDDPGVRARLSSSGLETDDDLVLRRVNHKSGRTRAYVNGRLVTVAQLSRLASGLVDISSQHEHHSLTEPSSHLCYLDSYAQLDPAREAFQQAWTELLDARTGLQALEEQARERGEREGFLRYQLNELAEAHLRAGEDDELADEARRMRHAERLSRATQGAEAVLYEQDNAVAGQLTRVVGGLEELASIDPRLGELARQLDSARIEIEEAARVLGQYGRSVHADPRRLAEMEERIDQLNRLKRRYGGSLEAAIAQRKEIAAHLSELEQVEVNLEDQRKKLASRLEAASAKARALSEQRKAAATRLGEAITAELHQLGMGDALVRVEVLPFPVGAHDFAVDGAPLTSSGLDRVEFLIAPNPGEEPRPLHRVASGGELSRALLALKTVLAGGGPAGTYVFDEVDAGVGGAVAEVIGKKLQELARHHQVLCITHLPQIAAFGEAHFYVSKQSRDGRTRSSITRLDDTGRVRELAEMMGGKQHTRATRKAAEDLLLAAQTAGGANGEEVAAPVGEEEA